MMTKDEANELAKSYLLSGMPIARSDEESPVMDAIVERIKAIFDVHMPDIRTAIKRYLDDDDQDAFFIALLPIHNKIWYEAYSPYWLLHCEPDSSDPDYTFFNDLINMYWHWKNQLWSKKEEFCVTIMLPPTRGLVNLAYQEARDSLKEYLTRHPEHQDHQAHNATVSGTQSVRHTVGVKQKGEVYG
jgi:hypothetical protein